MTKYLLDGAWVDEEEAALDTSAFVTTNTAQIITGLKTVTPSAAAAVGLIVKGVASQTANLQEWQSSAGTVLGAVTDGGSLTVSANIFGNVVDANVGVFGLAAFEAGVGLLARPPSASTVAVIVRGQTSQTANLQDWQSSAGTVLAKVDAAGVLTAAGVNASGNASVGPLLSIARLSVTTATASQVVVGVRGAASQTGDLQQWQNSAGLTLVKVDAAGVIRSANLGLGFNYGATTAGAHLGVLAASAGALCIVVRGFASQTADLQQWQNTGGTVLSRVAANGEPEVVTAGAGFILKSPDGTRYRVTVANGGTLTVAAA